VFPGPLYAILPYPVHYQPYTGSHLVSQFQLLLFAGLAFFAMLPMMKRTLTISLDWDWFYRRLGPWLAGRLGAPGRATPPAGAGPGLGSLVELARAIEQAYWPQGLLSRTWPTGSMVLWVALLLALCILLYL
jgi:multicomponent Na+:H+ antiporter subunit D